MPTLEHIHRRIIRGDRGVGLSAARAGLQVIEPFYAGVTRVRNAAFDWSLLRASAADRPVISVGNITTGGTGKTPTVCWLAGRLIKAGHQPAILMRGYRGGDEQRMLQRQLPEIVVQADPSRVQGASAALRKDPDISCFLLDDGFQHRKLRRDFDLLLIDATNPFGFGHVLPRGLLREPLRGLGRADAFVITHCEHGEPTRLAEIESTIRKYKPGARIFRAEHRTALRGLDKAAPAFSFCGIGNPDAFDAQLRTLGAHLSGSRHLADHHHYTTEELRDLNAAAQAVGARVLITTEKDWAKIEALTEGVTDLLPIIRATVEIEFCEDGAAELFGLILSALTSRVLA